jgi:hypothetical protein
MNNIIVKENINIEKINGLIENYFNCLNVIKELNKINTKFSPLYFEFSSCRPRTLGEIMHGMENLKQSNYKYKLTASFLKDLFDNLKLADFMNFEQKGKMTGDIEEIAKTFDVALKNVISLIQGYLGNADKAIYDSVTALAGRLTDRTSCHKTNSKAFKFQDKHILEMALSEFYHYRNDHVMMDVQKIHNLFYGNDKIINRWHNFVKWDNNIPIPQVLKLSKNLSIKVFKNKNVHILFSREFQDKLNNLISKNILK